MQRQEFLLSEEIRAHLDEEEKLNLTPIEYIKPFAPIDDYLGDFYISADRLRKQNWYFCTLFPSDTRKSLGTDKTLQFSDGTYLLPDEMQELVRANNMFCVLVNTIVSGSSTVESELFIFYGEVAKIRICEDAEIYGLGYYSSIHFIDSLEDKYGIEFNRADISVGDIDEFTCTIVYDYETSSIVKDIYWDDSRGISYLMQCLKYRIASSK